MIDFPHTYYLQVTTQKDITLTCGQHINMKYAWHVIILELLVSFYLLCKYYLLHYITMYAIIRSVCLSFLCQYCSLNSIESINNYDLRRHLKLKKYTGTLIERNASFLIAMHFIYVFT